MNLSMELTQPNLLTNIEFEELKTSEEIIIETRNSTYRFSVSDAAERRGYLSGGSVGKEPVKAILIGVIMNCGDSCVNDYGCLKTNGRAFFYLETSNGTKHLVTSKITGLIHIKNITEQKYIF